MKNIEDRVKKKECDSGARSNTEEVKQNFTVLPCPLCSHNPFSYG